MQNLMRALNEVDRARKNARDGVLQRESLFRAAARTDFACARGDVAFDTDVAVRFAKSAAHREDRELDVEFLTALGVANNFARVFARFGKLARYFRECVFAEIKCGCFAFEVVVGVAEKREMSAVLLKINAVRVDDGDGFTRVRENFAIQIGAQLYWSRSRLGMSFCGRHSNF